MEKPGEIGSTIDQDTILGVVEAGETSGVEDAVGVVVACLVVTLDIDKITIIPIIPQNILR